jgi:hypothetical protein
MVGNPKTPLRFRRVRQASLIRWGGVAAIASGVAWAIALPLVATEAGDNPVGLRYDNFNRLLLLPLVLLLVGLAGVRAAGAGRLSGWGRRGAGVALAGVGLLILGNVIEFWVVLASDKAVYAIAEDRPQLEEWEGSTVGWLTFLAGTLLLLVAGIVLAVALRRARILPGWLALLAALTAPFLLATFGVWDKSLAGTVAIAIGFGLSWVAIGTRLLRETSIGGAPATRLSA